jgi:hypothetical protein
MAVLKQENRALLRDARALCEIVPARETAAGSTHRRCWDLADLSWTKFECTVRVVRSEETTRIRRQLTKQVEETSSSWWWVTTLPQERASTQAVVDLGHRRWAIENEGFNEGVNAWHMDHVYRHEPRAMAVVLLLMMLAYNLLHVFYARSLKPLLRRRCSLQHIGREIAAELYAAGSPARAPP